MKGGIHLRPSESRDSGTWQVWIVRINNYNMPEPWIKYDVKDLETAKKLLESPAKMKRQAKLW